MFFLCFVVKVPSFSNNKNWNINNNKWASSKITKKSNKMIYLSHTNIIILSLDIYTYMETSFKRRNFFFLFFRMKRYPFSIRSSCFTTNSSFCSTNLGIEFILNDDNNLRIETNSIRCYLLLCSIEWSNTMKMLKWIEAKKTKNVWAEMFPHSLCIILWSLLLMQQKSTLIPQWLNSRIELRKVHFECNKNTKIFLFCL